MSREESIELMASWLREDRQTLRREWPDTTSTDGVGEMIRLKRKPQTQTQTL